jgi:hypothetical protein
MSEEAETCSVLRLRQTVAHFARRNTRSTETEEGSSGDVHASIGISANFGVH